MKQHFRKLLILVPLVLVAGATFAAYSFVGPTAAPTGNNTDGPLDISSSNQIKNGGLAVGTFQARSGSDFAQQTQFTGLVNGGTSGVANSTITVGNASDVTSVSDTGSTAIAGSYQSNSLKTGGGLKPLCASSTGTFYICGTTTPVNTNPIYVQATLQVSLDGISYEAGARLSETTNADVNVTISASAGSGSSAFNYIKNMVTAEAVTQGQCHYTATPTVVGTVTIRGGTTVSWNTVPLSSGCNATNTQITISSYSPTVTMGGRPIIAQ